MHTLDELRKEFGSSAAGLLGLDEYQAYAKRTYRGHAVGRDKLQFLLLGLFGETGSLLSELKKKQRDSSAYQAYGSSALEETGDVLWYLANVADVCALSLGSLSDRAAAAGGESVTTFHDLQPQATLFHEPASPSHVQSSLLTLASRISALVAPADVTSDLDIAESLRAILSELVSASTDAHVNLAEAAQANLDKLLARWPLRETWGPLLDAADHPSEQLPRLMRIRFEERRVGTRLYVYQSMNGIYIGDRLTDNSTAEDDYRFHDIFHLAFAAILGWSPVVRGLLKVKRKSRPEVDEQQDGARAAITEEGISNWIFAHGLRHDAFAHVDSLDFALLRTIGQMVKGYEVDVRPPWMWERAIFEGFRVFRLLREHRGGVVIANLETRSLAFEPPN